MDELELAKKNKKNMEFKAEGADLMKLPGASRGLVRVSSQRRFQNGNEDDVMDIPDSCQKHFGSAIQGRSFGPVGDFPSREETKTYPLQCPVQLFLNVTHLRRKPQAGSFDMCRQTSRGCSKCSRFGTFWTSWSLCFLLWATRET